MAEVTFQVTHNDPTGRARCGVLALAHGRVETPVFMPVGTLGTVKAIMPKDLQEIGTSILLGNTYHLMLRPGAKLIEQLGGLHHFMGWNRPILTDSGGFQVWSLGQMRKIEPDGVRFRSHIDGSEVFLGPKESMQVQRQLGSDIVMVFDECTSYPADFDEAKASMQLSMRWGESCREYLPKNPEQALFGIIQGGMYPELRLQHLAAIIETDFEGIAIGGLSVGEPKEEMFAVLDCLAPALPVDKPHYLMGVGTPADLIESIDRGIDMFDCVMPTRNARNGMLFTDSGPIRVKHACYREDNRPPMEACECYTCRYFSMAYLRHLYMSHEILSSNLNTLHNLHYYLALMSRARRSIREGKWPGFRDSFLYAYRNGQPKSGEKRL